MQYIILYLSRPIILIPYLKNQRKRKGVSVHLSHAVVELPGSNDHLHLKNVAFGDALLHQILQHFLLVQSDGSEETKLSNAALLTNTLRLTSLT